MRVTYKCVTKCSHIPSCSFIAEYSGRVPKKMMYACKFHLEIKVKFIKTNKKHWEFNPEHELYKVDDPEVQADEWLYDHVSEDIGICKKCGKMEVQLDEPCVRSKL